MTVSEKDEWAEKWALKFLKASHADLPLDGAAFQILTQGFQEAERRGYARGKRNVEVEELKGLLGKLEALLKERDATIEKLRTELKELQDWRTGRKGVEDYYTLKSDLAAERLRAEAYRRARIQSLMTEAVQNADPGQTIIHAVLKQQAEDQADSESRKLLAERSKEGKDR